MAKSKQKKQAFNKTKDTNTTKAQTPQPQKKGSLGSRKMTPKSEPHPKRKKLSEEISDEEFEEMIKEVKEKEKKKQKLGTNTPTPKSPQKDDSEDESDSDDEDFDLSNVDFDKDDFSDGSDEDDDESDEDDSEDDGEEENNTELKRKLAKKFKSMMENAASDSDDDDDGDDDDDDDSDSEESPPPTKKIKSQEKQNTNTEVQVENGKKTKKRKAENSPVVNGKQQKITETDMAADVKAKDEQDSRTIFLKGLPIGVMEENIKELFEKSLRQHIAEIRKRSIKKKVHAFVEFTTKEKAKKGHSSVKGKKIGNQDIIVDFLGKDSVHKPQQTKLDPESFDPLRLYISGFNRSATLAQVQKLFQGASKVQLPMRRKSTKAVGFAFAHYKTEGECKKAHDAMQGTVFKDRPLIVLFAKKTTEAKKSDTRPEQLVEKVEAKKQKLEKQKKKKKGQEEDSDDSDEAESDDEDEEDEDESEDGDDNEGDDDSDEDAGDNDESDEDDDESDEDTGSE